MRKKIFLLMMLLWGTSLMGCGYTTRSNLPADLRTVYVSNLKNSINYSSENGRNLYLPLLEIKAHDAIVERFMFDGNLRVAKENTADLVLTGELTEYRRDALSYTDNNDVREYRISITVSLEMMDTKKNEVMWKEPSFRGESTFFLSGPQAKTEDAALEDALDDLARRVVERTVENW